MKIISKIILHSGSLHDSHYYLYEEEGKMSYICIKNGVYNIGMYDVLSQTLSHKIKITKPRNIKKIENHIKGVPVKYKCYDYNDLIDLAIDEYEVLQRKLKIENILK